MSRPPHNTWVQGNSAGVYTSPVDKFLIHTTEGTSIAGAIGAYQANNSWPHLTVDARHGLLHTITGHLDLDVPARSLRNMAGGVETNTDGVVQIEVVGFATRPGEIDWAWIGQQVAGPICRTKNIPVVSTVSWVAYPASYGLNAPQRLSPAAWTAYRGILGHQHAPENTHGDPGAIPIGVLLEAAGSTPTPEDDVTPEDHAQIMQAVRDELKYAVGFLSLRTNRYYNAETGFDGAVTLPQVLVAAQGGDVDTAALAAAVLAVLTPQAIAAAIPVTIAGDVANELAERLRG